MLMKTLLAILALLLGAMPVLADDAEKNPAIAGRLADEEIPKSDDKYRQRLTPEQFEVARKKGTEK